MHQLITLASLAAGAVAGTILPRQSSSNTASIDLSVNRGSPQHLAAGILYGIPGGFSGMTPSQIPDSLYSNWNYYRIGGAQMSQGGWVTGFANYKARFQNSLSDYKTARKFGAKVILLPHDIYGTDHLNSNSVWPGDNGNWTDYDNFLNQLLSDIKANNMLPGLVYDIWNEPDGSGFWARSQAQYLQLWQRTYNRIRGDSSLSSMLISGPSSAGQPRANSWYSAWLQFVVRNKVIPDQYSWHAEPSDPQYDYQQNLALLSQYGAPTKPININEYATFDQQVAAGSAWFISRLERINANGLRGNWLPTCQLHDFLASMLTKSNTNSCGASSYSPNGDWWTYQYYTHNMTGTRTGTTGSGDGAIDVFATVASDKLRLLTGVIGSQTGTWYITIRNMNAVGFPSSGSVSIDTYGLIDNGHFGAVAGPTYRNTISHTYSGNTLTFPIFQTQQDLNTAWVFEIAR